MARTRKKSVIEQGLLFAAPLTQESLTAGADEAGRGCLAGPVVAGAVIFPDGFDLMGLDDSKVLKAEERDRLAAEIRQLAVGWGIGLAWMDEIARINILQASLMAMTRAVAAMRVRMKAEGAVPARLLIDGTQIVPPLYFRKFGIPAPEQEAVVDGDALVPAISAASVLAKTFRDDLMVKLDARWPDYGFARHKGYGTKEHREALAKFGPCPLHRLDFHGVLPPKKQEQGRLC
ncbi:ribonuclease HII [Mailhella sp.]|uniref:ribonuclease HII n=1 Tax=Mailhella sp. TaxID=1981029 RepID=UPI004063773D